MAFNKTVITSDKWQLVGNNSNKISFVNVGSNSAYVLVTTSNTVPTDEYGLVYKSEQGELKISPSILSLSNGSFLWAKAISLSTIIIWEANTAAPIITVPDQIVAPVNTTLPVITGTAKQFQILTCSSGIWSNDPVGYTYQWKKSNSAIVGATSTSYLIAAGDLDAILTCTITAINSGGSTSVSTVASATVGPTFIPAFAIPQPTGTTVVVSTADSFNTAYQAAVPGDRIMLANGEYDAATALPLGWNKTGVIVQAQNFGAYDTDPMGANNGIHFARFERKAWIVFGSKAWNTSCYQMKAAVGGIIGIGFKLAPNLWPANNTSWSTTLGRPTAAGWPMINSELGTADDPKIYYCEAYTGYGPNNVPYDPAIKYFDSNSPSFQKLNSNSEGYTITPSSNTLDTPGWGDEDYSTYNRIFNGPYFFRRNQSNANGSTFYANYIHDMSRGIKSPTSRSGVVIIQYNWFSRIYQDFITLSSANLDNPSAIIVNQNIWQDPIGCSYDSGNPHSDTNQFYIVTPSANNRIVRNLESNRNILFAGGNTRGTAQINFWQMSGDHYRTVSGVVHGAGIKMRENIGFMSGSSHVADTGVSSFYIRDNMSFHPIGQVNDPDTTRVQIAKSAGTTGNSFPANKSAYLGNITEGTVYAGADGILADTEQSGNIVIGNRNARVIPDSSIFVGDFTIYPSTIGEMYNSSKRKGIYVSAGPKYQDVSTFLQGPIDWSGETPFIGFPAIAVSVANTLTLSHLSEVYGGNVGDLLAVVPGPSVEWKSLATDRTTQLSQWTSNAGTVAVSQNLIQLRGYSPSVGNINSLNIALAENNFNWNLITNTNMLYPTATFDGANTAITQPNGIALAADSKMATMAFAFSLSSAFAIANNSLLLYGQVSGSQELALQVQGSRKLKILARDSVSNTVLSYTTSTVCKPGSLIRVLVSIDSAQSDMNTACFVYIDNGTGIYNLDSPFSGSSYKQDNLINFAKTGVRRQIGSSMENGSLSYFWLKTGVALDVSDVFVQIAFNRNNIGANGAGPTGVQPEVFVVGYDKLLNSIGTTTNTDSNLGTAIFNRSGANTWITTNGRTWP